jgi:UDP:flavonoid glycosyltransferase YjiC (YdhE family)
MHILILTLGSRGDVQPYIALGKGLQAARHTVTLASLQTFEGMVAEHHLAFRPLRGEFLALLQTPEGKAAMIGKGNPLALMRKVTPMLRGMLDDGWNAAQGVDAIIYHPKALGGHSIAEKLGIPGVIALPLPLYSPTRAFPSPILPTADLGAALNRASHRLIIRLASASTRTMLNRWRKQALGMPPAGDEMALNGRPILRLYGYSPALVPMPPDWDAHSIATGYWFLDCQSSWRPPESLVAFLRAGPPPIYIGFGSMPSHHAAAKTALVRGALERAGQRGILAAGWGGLSATTPSPNIYVLEAVPHDWLFPHIAAVVHHGGAGTTGAGLRAGAPTVICPFFGDQPFWGRWTAKAGVGPQPIPQKRLTVERLAEAISVAASDGAMRERATRLGAQIRAENGVARAVALVEARIGRRNDNW